MAHTEHDRVRGKHLLFVAECRAIVLLEFLLLRFARMLQTTPFYFLKEYKKKAETYHIKTQWRREKRRETQRKDMSS